MRLDKTTMAAEPGVVWHRECGLEVGTGNPSEGWQTAEEAIRARASAGPGGGSSLGQEGESYLE